MTIPEYFLAFLLVANIIAVYFSNARRLQDVERKLNLLLARLDVDPTSQVSPSSRVIGLAADPQQRVAAIKAYRLETGAGLMEAAAVINHIASGPNGAGAQQSARERAKH